MPYKTCVKCKVYCAIEEYLNECHLCLGYSEEVKSYRRKQNQKDAERRQRDKRMLLSLGRSISFVLISLFMIGCVASSKYVTKVSKAVEANSKNHNDLVNALDANSILPKESIEPLKTNSKKTLEYSSDLAKENPSAFTWGSFKGVLDGLLLVSNAIGTLFGVPPGTIEKGVALITLVGGFFGHKTVMRRKEKEAKRKVKIAEKLKPEISEAYREAEKKTLEEEKA